MDRRIKLYSKCLYGFGDWFHLLLYKYKVGTERPDSVEPIRISPACYLFCVYSIVVQTLFMIYWYSEAFLGNCTGVEFLFIIGASFSFILMNVSQWYYLVEFYRGHQILLMNAVLGSAVRTYGVSNLAYELIYMNCIISGFVFSVIWFPGFILLS